MLRGNIDGHGNVDTHNMMMALLQYRNTPNATTGLSPACMLFGQRLNDALPTMPTGNRDPTTMSYLDRHGRPSRVWDEIRSRREDRYRQNRAATADRYNIDKSPLPPLSVGDSVSMQNGRGPHPNRWKRTGLVVERLENRQYLVKADGSGKVLLRTRGHLRKICPTTRDRRQDVPPPSGTLSPLLIPGSIQDGTKVIHPVDDTIAQPDNPCNAVGPAQGSPAADPDHPGVIAPYV